MQHNWWAELLSSTARLTDVYDSQRQVGRTDVQAPIDQKRTNSSGLWFAVAVNILEYLQQQENLVPGRYVSRKGVYLSVETDEYLSGSGVTTADIDACIRSLSTPFELNFLFLGDTKQKIGDTELVEEATSGKGIRLAPRGKIACYLAYGITDWIYTDVQVVQLKKALEINRFDNYCKFADALVSRLYNTSHEITSLRELPGANQKRRRLMAEYPRYIETIKDTDCAIKEVFDYINSNKDDIKQRIEQWALSQVDENSIENISTFLARARNIRIAVEILQRNLHALYEEGQADRDELIETVNFFEFAKIVLKNWQCFSSKTFDRIFYSCGLFSMSDSGATLSDILKPVRRAKKRAVKRKPLNNQVVNPVKYKIAAFLRKYQSEIAERLKNGPLSLMEIIGEEAFDTITVDGCAALVGCMFAPSLLGFDQGTICITVDETYFFNLKTKFGSIQASDLVITYTHEG